MSSIVRTPRLPHQWMGNQAPVTMPDDVEPVPVDLTQAVDEWTQSNNTAGASWAMNSGALRFTWTGADATTEMSSTAFSACFLIDPTPLALTADNTTYRHFLALAAEFSIPTAQGVGIGLGLFTSASSPTEGVGVMVATELGGTTVDADGPQGESTDTGIGTGLTPDGGMWISCLPQSSGSAAWDAMLYDPATGELSGSARASRGGAITNAGGATDLHWGVFGFGTNGTAGVGEISALAEISTHLRRIGGI